MGVQKRLFWKGRGGGKLSRASLRTKAAGAFAVGPCSRVRLKIAVQRLYDLLEECLAGDASQALASKALVKSIAVTTKHYVHLFAFFSTKMVG